MNGRAIAVLAGAAVGLLGLAAASDPEKDGAGRDDAPPLPPDPEPTGREELEREFQRIRTELREALANVRGEIRDDVEGALREHTRATEEGVQELQDKLAHVGRAADAAAQDEGDDDPEEVEESEGGSESEATGDDETDSEEE